MLETKGHKEENIKGNATSYCYNANRALPYLDVEK
jgi:hypothetical protein